MLPWRFIDSGPRDGAANMAVDEALLACFDPQTSRPLLRIYGWEPPALSLGRFQKAGEILDRERCGQARLPVVRRITGGGVIYHAGEITYSLVCAPHHVPPAASIKESFRVLTAFLIRFYAKLGLDARYALEHFPAGTKLGERTDFCFAGKESYDIMIDGKKIGGNAQRRLKDMIFQHGSIPVVNHAAYGAGFLREPLAGIEETAGALYDFGAGFDLPLLKKLLLDAFMESHATVLEEAALTEKERVTAASLALKHASAAWAWEGDTDGKER
jgi:lipoate-protein ligase A